MNLERPKFACTGKDVCHKGMGLESWSSCEYILLL